jgi:hypothetical protein
VRATHRSLFDGSLQGIELTDRPAFSFQGHPEAAPGPRDVKVLKYSKRAGQHPEVKTLRVLGNQRLTPGGNVKRAKPKPKISLKKRSQT